MDVLRLWAAGVDYTKDVAVGPSALAQVSESVRRLRNTARFILGNIADGKSSESAITASRDEMSLVSFSSPRTSANRRHSTASTRFTDRPLCYAQVVLAGERN